MMDFRNLMLTLFIFSFVIFEAFSDQRSFVWTYEYMIMEPGKAELEQYTTFSDYNADLPNAYTKTELNFELEAGMHKNYDFAVYQNFVTDTNGRLTYNGFKLRARYKIGEKGNFFIDPLIYLEYKGVPDFSSHTIETKLILAKDFDNFRLSLNPYFELEFEDDEIKFEPEYALGFAYKLSDLLTFGIEAKGSESGNYFGPTISHGKENLWMALGTLFQVGEVDAGKPDFMLRFIIGAGL